MANLIAAAPTMYEALDEADTAFATIQICDGLSPQARAALGVAWTKVQDAIAMARPDSNYAKVIREIREEAKKCGAA